MHSLMFKGQTYCFSFLNRENCSPRPGSHAALRTVKFFHTKLGKLILLWSWLLHVDMLKQETAFKQSCKIDIKIFSHSPPIFDRSEEAGLQRCRTLCPMFLSILRVCEFVCCSLAATCSVWAVYLTVGASGSDSRSALSISKRVEKDQTFLIVMCLKCLYILGKIQLRFCA